MSNKVALITGITGQDGVIPPFISKVKSRG